jgi:ribose 5-phosphate isomerase B
MAAERFSIITEADARRIAPGTTVELAKGGHVTPLAQDTLRERRITVVPAGTFDASLPAGLGPVHPVRSLAIGSDHTGLALKAALVAAFRKAALAVTDVGTLTADPVDYPDIASAVALMVNRREADAGIVIDGSGLASAMAANKVRGVRAALCATPTLARYAREHMGANVLTLGSTLVDAAAAVEIATTFVSTGMTEARYLRRLLKVRRLEESRS